MAGTLERHSDALQSEGLSPDRQPMSTPAPDWMPASCQLAYPRCVQRKAVTLCRRDRKRGGVGNAREYRLAIHAAVLASGGRDHWTGEPLDWEQIGTNDTNDAKHD